MANNDLGKKAVEEVVKVFAQYANVVEEAALANEEFKKSGKIPSGFVQSAQQLSDVFVKLKAAGAAIPPEINKWVVAQRQLSNVQKREQKELEKTVGLYNKVDRGLKAVQKSYRDLALRKELNGKLSAKEVVELGKLEAKINKYDAALKKVDASMGRNQRNVGNYGRAFDSLGFSVAQITREAPAFLISMNTGFMAISNNIPILVDELNRLKLKNVELAASGKPTVSILKQLGGAIFSWQSAISAGIVVLTVLGPKLIEWATGMSEAEKATEEATKALDEQNESLRKNIELRSKLVGDLRRNFEDANRFVELTNSDAGLQVLQTIFEKIGESADVLTDQNVLLEDRRTIAQNLLRIEELKIKNDKEILKIAEDRKKLDDAEFSSEQARQLFVQGLQLSYQNTLDTQKEINKLNAENERIIGKTVVLKAEGNKEDEIRLKNLKTISNLQSKGSVEDKGIAATIQMTEAIRTQIKEIENILDVLPEWAEGYDELAKKAEDLKAALDGINVSGALKEGQDALNRILNPPSEEEGSGWKDYFGALVPLAQSTFQLVAQAQRAATQQALADLEKQKDLAIQFAGESAEARTAIEEQYAEKQAAIKRKQAENEKTNTIFNILLNTAKAVVSALPNLGLSIAVGAIGAAQLAFAASQPIPEFADGVRGFGGGLAIVGDGGRSEVVRTPDGKVFKTPSKDTLVNLPKGSDVFSSEDEFNQELTKMLNMSMISNSPLISKPELTEESMSAIISRLEDTIRNKESIEIIEDERGKRVFKKRLNARTEILNNRRRIQGRGI